MYNEHLTESLRRGDLKNFVSEIFSVDKFKSKMGEDQDILVLGFKVRDKLPAIDLMEFIEKGYNFILDADISAGEEHDGQYQVFVELERTPALTSQLMELFSGISQLCDCYNWRFRYQSGSRYFMFNEETVSKQIPMTPDSYKSKILEIKNTDIKDFFNQGAVEVSLDESNNLIFKKPFAGDLYARFVSIGKSKDVEKTIPGALSLDESSQSQVLFLNKYLGNYEIHKIGNKFFIKNGNNAVIIEKDRW